MYLGHRFPGADAPGLYKANYEQVIVKSDPMESNQVSHVWPHLFPDHVMLNRCSTVVPGSMRCQCICVPRRGHLGISHGSSWRHTHTELNSLKMCMHSVRLQRPRGDASESNVILRHRTVSCRGCEPAHAHAHMPAGVCVEQSAPTIMMWYRATCEICLFRTMPR